MLPAMPSSEHLKDFKAVWGDSCQSMWAELLALTIAESHIVSNYNDLPTDRRLTDMFYAPELRGRLDDLKKDTYLGRVNNYRMAVITNRIIVLSASFETYLGNFIDAFIRSKPKLYSVANDERTPAGDKLYGEVTKIRGLSARIEKFAELANSKIASVRPRCSYLDDVYMLRNVLAHRAGRVDDHAASVLKHLKFNPGERVSLSTDELLVLAAPVIKIAEILDAKLSAASV